MPFLVDGQNRFFAPRGKIDFRDPFRFHAFLLQKRPQKWGQKPKLGFKNRFLFLLFFSHCGFFLSILDARDSDDALRWKENAVSKQRHGH